MTLALLAARDAAPLPMPWSRIKRVLDSMEARFVRGALRLQEARVRALEPLVERVLETGLVPALIPLEGDFPAMVADFAAEVLVEGLVHASADVRAEEQRARSAGVNLKVDGEPVVPKDAVAFLESRRDLARFFDPDQVQKVRTILGNSLREGATVKQTMDALQTALPAASRARLENIARTEATAAYNQGRVYRFLQSQGFIVAVQFMATLDSRVTDICQHRNGLVFSLKDPRIRENTPPLHFQCRSILSPVSGYKLQKMGGQERLDKDARAMDDAPGVQVTKKGRFGNEPWPDAPGGDQKGQDVIPTLDSPEEGRKFVEELLGTTTSTGRTVTDVDAILVHFDRDKMSVDADRRLLHANWVKEALQHPTESPRLVENRGRPGQLWYSEIVAKTGDAAKAIFVWCRLDDAGSGIQICSFVVWSNLNRARRKLGEFREGKL